jgi:hypothetical protein
MVINGGIGFAPGLYVEITDQVEGAEKGSQGEKTETDYTRPEEIFHGEKYSFFEERVKASARLAGVKILYARPWAAPFPCIITRKNLL